MKEYRYRITEDELWYLGVCAEGIKMPISADTEYEFDLTFDYSSNQTTTALISNKGRYIYSEDGFKLKVSGGEIIINSKFPIVFEEGLGNLKGAFLDLSKRFFASDGKLPPIEFFEKPQFCTWIEFTYYVTQDKVLSYAKKIREEGIECGVFIIDCGWSTNYGSFKFNAEFPNPKQMVKELHDNNLRVMLWVCPFVTADTIEFRYLRDNGMLIKGADGKPVIREWWDGFSAILDMTNPATYDWVTEKLDFLKDEYGFDGFKFDAGDQWYYRDDDVVYNAKSATESSQAWAKLGLRYSFNEYRASSNMGGKPLVQRLKDKHHSFGEYGIASLVPATLMQNLFGYYYTCPDMIGGGDYMAFKDESTMDQELIVRYCQCSALMPMMQFSLAPWRLLSAENLQRIKNAIDIHKKLVPYFKELVHQTAVRGEPIIRLMEYNYPNCGFGKIIDQFMIGDKYLCAPVIEKGIKEKTVVLPKGTWKYGEEVYNGGEIVINIDLDSLPLFEKIC